MGEDYSEYEACNATNLTLVGSIYTTMVSSVASVVGSCLIIISFAVWSDLRTTARAILVFLAIADLFTALGYLFASILFLANYNKYNDIPPSLCTFQSFITTAFPISSFLWTANLAVYLFVSITLRKAKMAKKLMLLFHITAWGIPLLLCIPGAAAMVLGGQKQVAASTQGTVAWCWVSFNNSFDNRSSVDDARFRLTELHMMELVFGKLWEICVFIIAIVLCVSVKISLQKKKKEIKMAVESAVYGNFSSKRAQAALEQLDQKLIWIPIVFVLFRAWGTLRWLIATTYPECENIDRNCSVLFNRIWFSEECINVIYNPFLVYMQSIGDTGQGWGNALLYVIFNVTIFKRVCPCLYSCWKRIKKCYEYCRRRSEYVPIQYTKTEEQDGVNGEPCQLAKPPAVKEVTKTEQYTPVHMDTSSINSKI